MIEERELFNKIERAFAIGIQTGVINTLSELGLLNEQVTEKQAHAMYGEELVKEWRRKRWIVGYPSGNKVRAKFYYTRSELETAQRMLDYSNIIPPNILSRKEYQEDLDHSFLKEIKKRT